MPEGPYQLKSKKNETTIKFSRYILLECLQKQYKWPLPSDNFYLHLQALKNYTFCCAEEISIYKISVFLVRKWLLKSVFFSEEMAFNYSSFCVPIFNLTTLHLHILPGN